MNWDAIGAVGEVGGAVAVVATLVYLAKQIQQSTAVARQTAYVGEARILQDMGLAIGRDPTLAHIVKEGLRDPDSLDAAERASFEMMVSQWLYGFESLLRSYERGLIDKDQWDNSVDNALEWFSSPHFRAIAQARTSALGQRFATDLERRLAARARKEL